MTPGVRGRSRDAVDVDAGAWRDHVAVRAPHWFPELVGGDLRVEPVGQHRRRLSTTVVLRVGRDDTWRQVVVKHDVRSDWLPRPRADPPEDAGRKHETEWRALCLLERRLAGVDDLRAIRPLEHEPRLGAIVMEWLPSTSLRRLLGPGLHRATPVDRPVLLERVGRLVRIMHDLPPPPPGPTMVAREPPGLAAYVDYLSAHGADRATTSRLRDLTALVDARLPAGPAGLQHADLAPRNVLVDPRGRAILIDMLASTVRPRAADLAYLRASMRVAMHPVAGAVPGASERGLWRAERDVLRGYLGRGATDAEVVELARWIDVHEVLVLVDQWSALVATQAQHDLSRRRRWKLRLVRSSLDDAVARVSEAA